MFINCHTSFNPLKRTITPSNLQWSSTAIVDPVAVERAALNARFNERNETLMAARAAYSLEKEQPAQVNPREWVQDQYLAYWPDSNPEWAILDALWDQIIELPCPAMVLRELLQGAAWFRSTQIIPTNLNAQVDLLTVMLQNMIERISLSAEGELDCWEEHDFPDHEDSWYRPSNVYRRYGLALRYAVEELGSFTAKYTLNRLMLSVTLPVDELENPDWIDGYTGQVDPQYEFIRVREVVSEDVSSDGNLPATLADLMDNLGEAGREAFEADLRKLGMDTGDYWRQFIEAQRSGFTMVPEPEELAEDDDTDSIEKDFEFKADLMVDYAEVEAIQSQVVEHARRIRELMALTANEVACLRQLDEARDALAILIDHKKADLKKPAEAVIASKLQTLVTRLELEIDLMFDRIERDYQEAEISPLELFPKLKTLRFKYPVRIEKTSLGYLRDLLNKKIKELYSITWELARARFFTDRYVRELVGLFSRWGESERYAPKNLMAVLLPFQNAYGFREDDEYGDGEGEPCYDLLNFRIPHAWGGNLHEFMHDHGEVYLEQFVNGGSAGIVASSDPDGDTLEHWTNDLVADRARTYLSKNGAKLWRLVYRDHEGTMAEKQAVADQWFNWIYERERAALVARLEKFHLKPNKRNNREFIEAEVAAALMGDGGQDGPQQAGWDAYRTRIDPDANGEFKRVYALSLKAGLSKKDANRRGMDAFWVRVEHNRNKVVNATKTGLVLGSGRVVDWGIAKLKFSKGEIPTSKAELERLLKFLEVNKLVPWFQAYVKMMIKDFDKEVVAA